MKKTLTQLLLLGATLSVFSSQAEISAQIQAAINHPDRAERESARDPNRKPAQVLSILGVKPGMKVIDLNSGGGYYTELLSRVVGDKGQVIAHNSPYVVNRFANFFTDEKNGWPAKFKSKQWKKNVSAQIGELDSMSYGVGVDAMMMVLFYHDTVWQGVNRKMMNQHIFNALKPGGAFLIIDHSGKTNTGTGETFTYHRIDKQAVIKELTEVGFTLEVDSDILANPKDTRDYSFVRDVKTNRDQTDRMVLKFVKPII